MEIIKIQINRKIIIEKYLNFFKTMVKGVVDVSREIIALDAELHSDLEEYLLEDGSRQEDLWGINLYPFKERADFIEYTSLINIRPHQNNLSMEVENLELKETIKKIVNQFIND